MKGSQAGINSVKNTKSLKKGINRAHVTKYPFSHVRKLNWAFSKTKNNASRVITKVITCR